MARPWREAQLSDRGIMASGDSLVLAKAADAAGIAAYSFDCLSGTFTWFGILVTEGHQGTQPVALPRTLSAFISLIDQADRPTAERSFLPVQPPMGKYDLEYRLASDSGSELWLHDRGRVEMSAGRVVRCGALSLIPPRHRHQATRQTDELTGFLSRGMFLRELARRLNEPGNLGLLTIAVDGLALMNETYGVVAGDRMVAAVAARIHSLLDHPAEAGRLAGNRLAVMLPDGNSGALARMAERIMRTARSTVLAEAGMPIVASVSVGGTILVGGAATIEDALVHGKESLRKARRRSHDGYAEFRPTREYRERVRRQAEIAASVIDALQDHRIELAFQPIVRMPSREVAFYEALVRLRQADGTLIPAADFVPFTERSGLVQMLDRRTLTLAIQTLRDRPDVYLSINVSAHSLEDEGWSLQLERLGRETPEVAKRLSIELTESAAIEEMEEASRILGIARAMGCQVMLDDFGGGYLTPRHLRQLSIDMVKIDGSYIRDLANDHSNSVSVASMVALAAAYRIPSVAEHVESESDAEICHDLGVEYLQGYLFGRPGPLPPLPEAGS